MYEDRRVPTPSTAKWPKPRSEDEFEDIVVDFLRIRWNDPNAQRHGRRGQRQHGVDVIGHPARLKRRTAGGQCKNTDALTLADVVAEVDLAKTFPGGLAEFLIVTSGDRDVDLQTAVREHFKANRAPFRIELVFWGDIVADLARHDDLVRKHWKGFGNATSPMRKRSRVDAVDLRVRWDEELESMEAFYERAWKVKISLARELDGWETPFWTTRKRQLAQLFGDREWWVETTVLYRLWSEARRNFPTLQRYARPTMETGFRLERAAGKFREAKQKIEHIRQCLAVEAELESITEGDRADAIRICEAGAKSAEGTFVGFARQLGIAPDSLAVRLACAAWNYCCDAQPLEQDAAAASLLRTGWIPSVEVMMIQDRGASREFDRLRKIKGTQRGSRGDG